MRKLLNKADYCVIATRNYVTNKINEVKESKLQRSDNQLITVLLLTVVAVAGIVLLYQFVKNNFIKVEDKVDTNLNSLFDSSISATPTPVPAP